MIRFFNILRAIFIFTYDGRDSLAPSALRIKIPFSFLSFFYTSLHLGRKMFLLAEEKGGEYGCLNSVMPLQLDTEKWITREGKRQDLL